jgi:hypothetical protein
MPDQTQTPQEFIRQRARALGVPEALALGVADQESSFNPLAEGQEFENAPGHKTRAYGMFQVLPETAVQFGADPADPLKSLRDPVQGVDIGLRYLKSLHDQYGGQLDQVLATYGGVRTNPDYVPSATAKILQWQRQLEHEPPAGPPEAPPAPAPGSFAADHPYLNAMKQGLDPHEQGGRRNIAGAVGGAVGGLVGGLYTGGLGTAAAATGGAALFGGLEDRFVEQTGLGRWIGEHLPGGQVDEPVEPEPSVTDTEGDRLWRATKVGGEQGLYEGVGQAVFAPLRIAGRVALESRIGRTALDVISARKQAALAGLRDALDTLRAGRDVARVGEAQAGRALDATVGSRVEAARDAARSALEGVRAQHGDLITDAVTGKRTAVRDAARTGMAAREATQAESAAAEAALRAEADAHARLAAAQIEAAREAARASVEGARTAATDEITQATTGKRQGVREAVKSTRAARTAAQAEADADIEASRAAYQEHLRAAAESGLGPKPPLGTPSEVAAGRAVGEVFRGPGHAALDEAGQAVSAAAAAGPDRSLVAAQTEARRIMEEELAPHLTEFPREPAVAGVAGATGTPARPPMGDKLRALLGKIDDAQLQQLVEHPAMKVLSRIINAPETVDFATLHQLESQLRRSVQGSGDKVVNSYVTDTTRHVVGILRDTLAGRLEEGAAAHAPFEAATAHYADIVKLFTEGHAPLIKDVAVHAPEKIVQALSPDDPTPARMLVRVLTEQGEQGGGEALQRVQDAWIHRNLLTGPLDGLGDRIAALRLKPEFVDALLNVTPYGKELLDRAEQLGAAFKQASAQGAERVTAAREAARAAVGQATETGESAIAAARTKAAEAIRGARTTGREGLRSARGAAAAKAAEHDAAIAEAQAAAKARLSGVRETGREAVRHATDTGERTIAEARQKAAQAIRGERTTGRAEVRAQRVVGAGRQEAHKQTVEAAGLRAKQAVREAGAGIRKRAGSLGSTAAEQEERAFAASPLNPRAAKGTAAPVSKLEWALRAALSGAGYKALGPAGVMVGMIGAQIRRGAKVPEADLLRYVVHSDALTQVVINALFHPVPKQAANTVGGAAARGVGNVLKQPPPASSPEP